MYGGGRRTLLLPCLAHPLLRCTHRAYDLLGASHATRLSQSKYEYVYIVCRARSPSLYTHVAVEEPESYECIRKDTAEDFAQ